jgi:hypothetical protein
MLLSVLIAGLELHYSDSAKAGSLEVAQAAKLVPSGPNVRFSQ